MLACAKHYVGDGGTSGARGRSRSRTRPGSATPSTRATPGSARPSCGDPPARLPGGHRGRRRLHHAVLQQLERREGVRPASASSPNPQGRAGLRGLPHLRLQRHRRSCPATTASQIKQSIERGHGHVHGPDKYKEFYAALKDLAEKGEVPMSRIDDAVLRILRVKYAMGLMDAGRSPLADRSLQRSFGSPAASRGGPARGAPVAGAPEERQEGAARSPRRPSGSSSRAGARTTSATSAGGWTIDWQGKSGPITTGGHDHPGRACKRGGRRRTRSLLRGRHGRRGRGRGRRGGRRDALRGVHGRPRRLVAGPGGPGRHRQRQEGRNAGGGRRRVRPAADPRRRAGTQADAVVAAWLPGPKARAWPTCCSATTSPPASCRSRGRARWSRSRSTSGDAEYDPQFPFGYGLTY